MAVKQVKENFKKIEKQYFDMMGMIKEFDEALKAGEVSPEQAEEARNMFFKVEDNYKRWAYMMYLLNQPARKEKAKRYDNSHKKLKEYVQPYSIEPILEDGRNVLANLEKKLKELNSCK